MYLNRPAFYDETKVLPRLITMLKYCALEELYSHVHSLVLGCFMCAYHKSIAAEVIKYSIAQFKQLPSHKELSETIMNNLTESGFFNC